MAWLSHVDSTYDRYSRVFMITALLVTSFLMMVEHFSYRISCATPRSLRDQSVYVRDFCWSKGLFLYKEMIEDVSIESSHYGIPRKFDHDGILNQTKNHCHMFDIFGSSNEDCISMKPVYFKEYQWLPFYIGILSLLFLLPYVIFKMVNPDLYSLQKLISSNSGNQKCTLIIKSYFDQNVNTVLLQYLRVFFTLLVKIGYIAVNVFAFLYTASILKGNFRSYASDVADWGDRNESIPAVHPKTALLPTTGLCQLTDIPNDVTSAMFKRHLFICEIPSNVFYQNMLLFHWYIFIFGITISVTGFIVYIGKHVVNLIWNISQSSNSRMQQMITLRGMEYLDLIKEEDMALYSEVLREWKRARGNDEAKNILEEGRDEDFSL